LMQRRYLAFGLIAACFAAAMVLVAMSGSVQLGTLQVAQHLPSITLSTEPVGNETVIIPGAENGLVVALGGIAFLAAFLIFMLAITLRKRKKQGL
jgi:hypothetical protein